MKKTLSDFEYKLYKWNYYKTGIVKEFGSWLKKGGLSLIDGKPKEVRNAAIIGFAFYHHPRLFDIIVQKGL